MMCGLAMLFFGCEPTTPPNNALKKGHEDPVKVVFTFTPGQLAEDNIEDHIFGKGFTPDANAKSQSYVLEMGYDSAGKGTQKGDSKSDTLKLRPGVWYELKVTCYNRAEAEISGQFLNSKVQRDMHQFFYSPHLTKGAKHMTPGIMEYRYGDLTPNGSLFLTPIGFTGYARINPNTKVNDFYMWTLLAHLKPPKTKINRHTHKWEVFDNPTIDMMKGSVQDINLWIPMKVDRSNITPSPTTVTQ